MTITLWSPLLAFTVTLILVHRLTLGRLAQFAVDRPNERSLHTKPVPRTGGLGIHAGVLATLLVSAVGVPAIIIFLLLGLIAVSAWDDARGLPVLVRLIAQLLAGFAASAFMLLPEFGVGIVIVVAIGIAWMTNLYNFMDGSDGLAGGMTMFGFAAYGVAAWLSGNTAFASINFSIAAAAMAFLVFNFHPARIFMGDAGAAPLGFLAACLGIIGWLQSMWSWWFPLLIFAPFIVDASVTLMRRLVSRAKFWQAHRDHYYQRLIQMGWGHRRTAIAEYALMCVCGVAAIAGLNWPRAGQVALLVTMTLIFALLIFIVGIAWRKFQLAQNNEN